MLQTLDNYLYILVKAKLKEQSFKETRMKIFTVSNFSN